MVDSTYDDDEDTPMKRADIKPGLVLAWKTRWLTKAVKVTVVGPGETEGSKYSYQGPPSRPGWIVTVDPDLSPMERPWRSPQSTDTEGNYIALGRDLVGDWVEYQIAEQAEIAQERAYIAERDAKKTAEKQATIELKALLKRYDVLDDSWLDQQWPSPIDILATIECVVQGVEAEMY